MSEFWEVKVPCGLIAIAMQGNDVFPYALLGRMSNACGNL